MKYVDKNANLKELQQVELEILKYLDEVCQKHHLDYYIAYGTLLGAVRHKGFIPWDDDVDVVMKGPEYLKLANILKENNHREYFFQTLETEKNYYLLWNKIRKNKTIFIEQGWEKNNINKGISIDIFPLIEYPDTPFEYKRISFKFKVTTLLSDKNIVGNPKYKRYGTSGKILSKIFSLIPQKIRNHIVTKNMIYFCNYKSHSEYYFIPDEGMSKKVKKSDFDNSVKLPFEKYKFNAPYEYDNNLKDAFGDYMKLPKKEDRVGHGKTYLCFNTDK